MTADPPPATPPVRYDDYVLAAGLALARRHRPVWSRERNGMTCRCGADLPCRITRLILARDEWPGHRQMTGTMTVHTRDAAGFCTHCRIGHRIVRYPCQPVRVAVRTFAADLAELILDNL